MSNDVDITGIKYIHAKGNIANTHWYCHAAGLKPRDFIILNRPEQYLGVSREAKAISFYEEGKRNVRIKLVPARPLGYN